MAFNNTTSQRYAKTEISTKLLSKSFLVAGIGFVLIALIAVFTALIVDSDGVMKNAINNGIIYDPGSEYYNAYVTATAIGSVCIFVSMILSIVWVFRFTRSSKAFIVIAFTTYIVGQGIGFGTLLAIWNATAMISIFAIGGLIFGAMATVGYMSKDLTRFTPFIFAGLIMSLIVGIIATFVYIFGSYEAFKGWMLASVWMSAIIFTLYIAWDVNMIKKTQEAVDAQGGIDKDMTFKLVAFFGFRLLSDLIGLIWQLIQIFLLSRD